MWACFAVGALVSHLPLKSAEQAIVSEVCVYVQYAFAHSFFTQETIFLPWRQADKLLM